MIGVLDIHGDVSEHLDILQKLSVPCTKVKRPEEINALSGLIIPGGESTTMMRLMNSFGLNTAIKKNYCEDKLTLFGTCAGAIVLAKEILNYPNQESLQLLDISINRNGYGRQIQSFTTTLDGINAAFIRAPIIEKVGENVEVILSHKTPVLVKEGNILACTFHPEIMGETKVHEIFISMTQGQ